jgi:molybdopterin-biosynthesis enzyme MoeA-like protein
VNAIAGVVIGTEVLTGKVEEANGAHLVRRCRDKGLALELLVTVHDEVDAIVEAVTLARARAPTVVTSGGVGPTHDDVTLRAVALALGRPIVRDAGLAERLRAAMGQEPPPAALRMCDVPQGSEFWFGASPLRVPVVSCGGVAMLAGVPELFRSQLEAVLARFPTRPVALAALYLRASEPEIAPALDAAAFAMPDVAFGSYPTFDRSLDHRVKVTIEHRDAAAVAAALARLRATLPAGAIVREDLPRDGSSAPP